MLLLIQRCKTSKLIINSKIIVAFGKRSNSSRRHRSRLQCGGSLADVTLTDTQLRKIIKQGVTVGLAAAALRVGKVDIVRLLSRRCGVPLVEAFDHNDASLAFAKGATVRTFLHQSIASRVVHVVADLGNVLPCLRK